MIWLSYALMHLKWALPTLLIFVAMHGCIILLRKCRGKSVMLRHELKISAALAYMAVLLTATLELTRLWIPLFFGYGMPLVNWFGGTFETEPFSAAATTDIVQNIILFLPLGTLIQLLRGDTKWYKIALTGMIISLCIECLQFIIGRTTDVSDVLMNTLGTIIGWLIWNAARKVLTKLKKTVQ